jgi:hypothetical protein
MGIDFRHAGTEFGLLGYKLIGRVGIEVRNVDGLLGLVGIAMKAFFISIDIGLLSLAKIVIILL